MKQFLTEQVRKNPLLAMILCCAIPIGAILALSYLGVLGSWGYYGIMLLCPALHLVMCRMGHSSHHAMEDQPLIRSDSTLKE